MFCSSTSDSPGSPRSSSQSHVYMYSLTRLSLTCLSHSSVSGDGEGRLQRRCGETGEHLGGRSGETGHSGEPAAQVLHTLNTHTHTHTLSLSALSTCCCVNKSFTCSLSSCSSLNKLKSNQSLFVWCFSYRRVAQSALRRLKTTTEKTNSNKIKRRK